MKIITERFVGSKIKTAACNYWVDASNAEAPFISLNIAGRVNTKDLRSLADFFESVAEAIEKDQDFRDS